MPNNNMDSTVPGNTGADGKQTEIPAVSSRRRKLIKASAIAVPAIMTLRSGAVAAAASLNGCIERDAGRAALESVDTVLGDNLNEPAHDEWVRVTGKAGRVVTATVNGTAGVYYGVLITDFSFAYYDSTGVFIDPGLPGSTGRINQIENGDAVNFYCVNQGGVWECVDEGGGPVIPAVPVNVDIDAGKDVGLLVYVATTLDGDILGHTYYPKVAIVQDVDASPITGSCLCSVDPDFNILG